METRAQQMERDRAERIASEEARRRESIAQNQSSAWGDFDLAVRAGVEALFGHHPERGGLEREQAVFAVLTAAQSMMPRTYPHQDGDVTVIGPQCILSVDRSIISYKGETFVSAAVK